jgi:hypothetical protein
VCAGEDGSVCGVCDAGMAGGRKSEPGECEKVSLEVGRRREDRVLGNWCCVFGNNMMRRQMQLV